MFRQFSAFSALPHNSKNDREISERNKNRTEVRTEIFGIKRSSALLVGIPEEEKQEKTQLEE
jgi:hypothetical protein